MSTLQTIREKLRNLPFEGANPASACMASVSPSMGSSTSSSVSMYVVIGVIVGVLVTAVVVKLWVSYKEEKPVAAGQAKPPLPADQYIAQLAQHIKAQEAVPKIEPVRRAEVPRLQPVAHHSYPDTSTIGNMPQPEAGSQLTQPAQPQMVDQGPISDGLDTNDPFLTPV